MKNIVLDTSRNTGPKDSYVCPTVDTRAGTTPFGLTSVIARPSGGEAAMESVDLAELLFRAIPYERWRAPIHPRLRQAAIASGPIVLICLPVLIAVLTTAAVPSLLEALQLGGPEAWILGGLCGLLSLLALVDVAGLAIYIPMLVVTRGLQEARPHWHWVAFGEAILGAIHGFVVAVGLAIVAIAAIIGLAIMCLFAIIAILGLLGMAAAE